MREYRIYYQLALLLVLGITWFPIAEASDNSAMSNQRLQELISRIDSGAEGGNGRWRIKVEGLDVYIITDERADRMRILSPVVSTEKLTEKHLQRLLQANFDSALDARYSIAKSTVWSAFIHPLSSLGKKEFLSAVGQVVNLVSTYGTSYSSGALIFQGGDSAAIKRKELIEALIKKGLAI